MPRGSGSGEMSPDANKPLISRRPQQPAIVLCVEQRANADSVAAQQQFARTAIPKRDRKLSVLFAKDVVA